MDILSLALALLGILVATWALHTALQEPPAPPGYDTLRERIDGLHTALQELQEQPPQSLDPRYEAIEETLEAVIVAFGDLEDEVEEKFDANYRREQRIRETLRRAEAQYEESGELTPAAIAEIRQARELYGEGGEDEELHAMPEGMGGGTPSSVPGVTVEQLRQARMI